MEFNDLSPEMRAKALACETPEALLKLAEEGGYELSDEEIEAISGGSGWSCSSNRCENNVEEDYSCYYTSG